MWQVYYLHVSSWSFKNKVDVALVKFLARDGSRDVYRKEKSDSSCQTADRQNFLPFSSHTVTPTVTAACDYKNKKCKRKTTIVQLLRCCAKKETIE